MPHVTRMQHVDLLQAVGKRLVIIKSHKYAFTIHGGCMSSIHMSYNIHGVLHVFTIHAGRFR